MVLARRALLILRLENRQRLTQQGRIHLILGSLSLFAEQQALEVQQPERYAGHSWDEMRTYVENIDLDGCRNKIAE